MFNRFQIQKAPINPEDTMAVLFEIFDGPGVPEIIKSRQDNGRCTRTITVAWNPDRMNLRCDYEEILKSYGMEFIED